MFSETIFFHKKFKIDFPSGNLCLRYGINMKKLNNKYRNNNNYGNNQIYSLNYKFDSSSPAGKFNGTALDLIKKYNELAKDAQSNNDYVMAEVYRQYAEHYRKIVTEINEKKQQRTTPSASSQPAAEKPAEAIEMTQPQPSAEDIRPANEDNAPSPQVEKKSFTVIEVTEEQASQDTAVNTEPAPAQPKKRVYRRRSSASKEAGDATASVG